MKYLKDILILVSLILSLTACKKEKPKPNLTSLDLIRGELLLCGNGEFGEVNFSEACSYETRETFNLAISLLHSA